MVFIRKNLISKLIFNLIILSLVIGALFFGLRYFNIEAIPLVYFVASLGGLSLLFIFFYWIDIVSPIRIILKQVDALLAGRRYSKIFTTRIDEIGTLAHFFNQVIAGLGKASADIKDRERMLEELTIAHDLQRDILPLVSPTLPGMQIVAKNRPASEVGGDSFNIITSDDKTYIYVGDVTGHGVAAGLIMTMVNSLVSVFAEMYDNPYDVLINVNKHIKTHVKKAMFMTMVMLCWDHKEQSLTYVGAGHEHILVYRNLTGECSEILSGGIALGMVPDNSKLITEKEIELNDGDFVILYTDGITEARNNNGELFGLKRLEEAIKEHASQYSAEGLNYHVAKDVSTFMQDHKQDDDMTLIVLEKDKEYKGSETQKIETKW
ncbi:SpoIIE family protein phosphatase [Candidatus Peregrinibacteria bacterium]|nr:SpoIIE family protein phosphatase [Candidatus Peregrinibacteria bacterium]